MRTKLGAIVCCIGIIYISISLVIICFSRDITITNINISMIEKMLFSITIYSLISSLSDIIIQLYVSIVITKNISKIKACKFSEEIKLINELKDVKTAKSKPVEIISYWLNVWALPISIAIIFIKYVPSNIILTGITILTFGIVVLGNGLRDENNMFIITAEKDIMLQFYKHKYQSKEEEKEPNDRL